MIYKILGILGIILTILSVIIIYVCLKTGDDNE